MWVFKYVICVLFVQSKERKKKYQRPRVGVGFLDVVITKRFATSQGRSLPPVSGRSLVIANIVPPLYSLQLRPTTHWSTYTLMAILCRTLAFRQQARDLKPNSQADQNHEAKTINKIITNESKNSIFEQFHNFLYNTISYLQTM